MADQPTTDAAPADGIAEIAEPDAPTPGPGVPDPDDKPVRWTRLIPHGLGTSLAMWLAAFLLHAPHDPGAPRAERFLIPAGVVVAALALVLFLGALRAARRHRPPVKAALGTAGFAALCNLLVLAGLLTDHPEHGIYLLVSSIAVSLVVGFAAGLTAMRLPPAVATTDGTHAMARVSVISVFVMLGLGGLVTAFEAGLAVPDWPNTQGEFMIFFSLSDMTGGVFLEHSHRLLGTLVGLISLVTLIFVLAARTSPGVKLTAVVVFLLVVLQGVLGGLRVTGEFTTAIDGNTPDTAMAIVHGALGQLVFALMLALAAMTTLTWRRGLRLPDGVTLSRPAGTARVAAIVLAVGFLLQVVVGAQVRHLGITPPRHLIEHITLGILLAGFAVITALRIQAAYRGSRLLSKLGAGLLHGVTTQILLGFVAWGLVAVGGSTSLSAVQTETRALTAVSLGESLVTTAHQLLGALLLGISTLLALFIRAAMRSNLPVAEPAPTGETAANETPVDAPGA
jgi:cytochrome c oxidase assembly protein subunit 15